ncbi:MAG: protease pro-enzyme activation domain-containing protein [Terriglobales bacterium]|jgi:subtilase family serine protease
MRRSPSALLSPSRLLAGQLSALILSILIFSTFSFAAAPNRINGPIVAGQLIRLSAGVPLRAQPQFDRGEVEPGLKLGYMTLLTAPSASQQKAIDSLLAEQQDPRSPQYHRWLTPEQYADRFGLSPADIQKLTAWLQSQGFSIVEVARARNFIVFSGTSAQAESAFRTSIHNFNVNGEAHFSNTTPLSIPAALSGIVTGVRGLSNFRAKSYLQHKLPKYTYPVPDTNPQTYNLYLAPDDIATIYDIGALYTAGIDGTGQKLAVIGQTDVYLSDLNDFRSGFNLPTIPTSGGGSCDTNVSGLIVAPCNTTNLQYVLVNADPGGITSPDDLAEADLDLEWSGATARNAQIIYVNAPDQNGNGVWDAWYYAVNHNLAPVITMSYGACELEEALTSGTGEGTFVSDEAELKVANMQGITFMNSSGDSGAAGCDPPLGNPNEIYASGGLAVSYPASSPEVTGVGGTMVPFSEYTDTYWSTTNGPNGGSALCAAGEGLGACIPEGAWNDIQEIGAFCVANPRDCTGITNAQTAQVAIGLRSASGGGPSNCYTVNGTECTGGFPQPVWQQGLSIGQSTHVRFTPDVALLASPNLPGYIWCSDASCSGGILSAVANNSIVGGTSASSPVFAGMVTLLNQYVVTNGLQGSPGLGNINQSLYQIATYNQGALAFHKATTSDYATAPGSNQIYCDPATPSGQPAAQVCPAAVSPATEGIFGYLSSASDAITGYNLVTGLGSVDANNLAIAFGDTYVTTTTSIATTATPPVFEGQSVTLNVTVASPSKPNTATGAVTFYNNGSVFGSTTKQVAAGVASLTTTQLPVGSNSLTAAYAGNYSPSTSATPVVVNVIAPSFTLAATTPTLTVAQGATAGPDTITVTSSNGFVTNATTAIPLTYSCSGLPSESTCIFNPATATTSATVTVSIKTTAPSTSQLRKPLNHGSGPGYLYALLIPGLFGIVFTMGSRKNGTRGLRVLSLIVVLGATTMFLASCGGSSGGGSSNPGTPQGTYTVNVNATTGTVAGTAATVTLTVN